MTTTLSEPYGNNPVVGGTEVNYFFVCHRKLWLFSHNIQMEHTSEKVEEGKLLHQFSYDRKQKEIAFDGIKIDFFDKHRGTITEVKKTRSIEQSHIWQLKYYLFYLKQLGIELKGEMRYPLLRRKEDVNLSAEDEKEIKRIIHEVEQIKQRVTPPSVIHASFCKKCSYYELCYI